MTARLKEGSAVGMLCCGLALAFTALLLPPSGEIHESVLYLFAQILIYCGSVFGMDTYINRKIAERTEDFPHSRKP